MGTQFTSCMHVSSLSSHAGFPHCVIVHMFIVGEEKHLKLGKGWDVISCEVRPWIDMLDGTLLTTTSNIIVRAETFSL